jgi:hypothetical protein
MKWPIKAPSKPIRSNIWCKDIVFSALSGAKAEPLSGKNFCSNRLIPNAPIRPRRTPRNENKTL